MRIIFDDSWFYFRTYPYFETITRIQLMSRFRKYPGFETITGFQLITHRWPFSKSKFVLKSDRVNLVAPACPIECLLYLSNVRAIQYKLGPKRLTQLGNSNVLRLPVSCRVFETYQLVLRQLPEFILMSIFKYLHTKHDILIR